MNTDSVNVDCRRKHAEKKVQQMELRMLENLKTISEIRIGQKLYIKSNEWLQIQNSSWVVPESVYRWFYSFTRKSTIVFLEKFYESLFENINMLETNSNNLKPLHRYILSISDSKRGLKNLKVTYANDNNVSVKLDFILTRIDAALERLVDKLKLE